jgi:hypothetical protein
MVMRALPSKAPVRCAATGGAEATGLTVGDVDLKNRTIRLVIMAGVVGFMLGTHHPAEEPLRRVVVLFA